MNPLQHMIHNNLDQRASFPVPARDVYMVMARSSDGWHTIIPKTDDINHARRTLYAINSSGGFKRVVLCKAREIQGINSLRWITLECAIPVTAQIIAPSVSMHTLLANMQQSPANKNVYQGYGRRHEDMIGKQTSVLKRTTPRQVANLPLSLVIIGAVLSMQPIPLIAAVMMVVLDWAFVEEKMDRILDSDALSFFARYRQLMYMLIAVSVLMPAVIGVFMPAGLF